MIKIRIFIIAGILCFSLLAKAQNFEKRYIISNNCYIINIAEAADKGYFMGINKAPEDDNEIINGDFRALLVKTDINGNILWQKKIGKNKEWTFIGAILYCEDGSIILTGGTGIGTTTSFILKLNTCGEKEWLKVLVANEYNWGWIIQKYNDGFLFSSANNDKYSSLFHFSNNGNLLWQFAAMRQIRSISAFKNNCLLLGGFALIPWKNDPDMLGLRAMRTLVDSNGKQIWYKPYRLGENFYGMFANSLMVDNNNLTVGYDSKKALTFYSVIDEDGEEAYNRYFDSTENEEGSGPILFEKQNEYILLKAPHQPFKDWIIIVRTDGDASILQEVEYGKKAVSTIPNNMIKTSDGKFLICGGQDYYGGPRNELRQAGYVLKLNEDLSIATMDTNVYHYDYLCKDSIKSGEISFDNADTVYVKLDSVTVDETPTPSPRLLNSNEYVLYPNPVKDLIHIHIPSSQELPIEKLQVFIYDLQGRNLNTALVEYKDAEILLDINHFKPGIYMVVLQSSNKKMFTQKFMKL